MLWSLSVAMAMADLHSSLSIELLRSSTASQDSAAARCLIYIASTDPSGLFVCMRFEKKPMYARTLVKAVMLTFCIWKSKKLGLNKKKLTILCVPGNSGDTEGHPTIKIDKLSLHVVIFIFKI